MLIKYRHLFWLCRVKLAPTLHKWRGKHEKWWRWSFCWSVFIICEDEFEWFQKCVWKWRPRAIVKIWEVSRNRLGRLSAKCWEELSLSLYHLLVCTLYSVHLHLHLVVQAVVPPASMYRLKYHYVVQAIVPPAGTSSAVVKNNKAQSVCLSSTW